MRAPRTFTSAETRGHAVQRRLQRLKEAAEDPSRVLPSIFEDVEPVWERTICSGIMGLTPDGLPLAGNFPSSLAAALSRGSRAASTDMAWTSAG